MQLNYPKCINKRSRWNQVIMNALIVSLVLLCTANVVGGYTTSYCSVVISYYLHFLSHSYFHSFRFQIPPIDWLQNNNLDQLFCIFLIKIHIKKVMDLKDNILFHFISFFFPLRLRLSLSFLQILFSINARKLSYSFMSDGEDMIQGSNHRIVLHPFHLMAYCSKGKGQVCAATAMVCRTAHHHPFGTHSVWGSGRMVWYVI